MSFTIIKLAENLKRMEAKELRIGSLVLRNETVCRIAKIDERPVSKIIKPIQLTDEWPNKFGYEDFVDMSCDLAKKSKYPIEIVSDDLLKLKVHELQNLWTSLTGEELEIK